MIIGVKCDEFDNTMLLYPILKKKIVHRFYLSIHKKKYDPFYSKILHHLHSIFFLTLILMKFYQRWGGLPIFLESEYGRAYWYSATLPTPGLCSVSMVELIGILARLKKYISSTIK